MIKRMAGRVGSAHVIAMIALVVALSGGAFAVGGPGALQLNKAQPTAGFTSALNVAGFGQIQHACDSGDSKVDLRFRNNVGGTVVFRAFGQRSGEYTSGTVGNGDESSVFDGPASLLETYEVHLFKGGKQATVTVSTSAAGGFCLETRSIALNSAA